MEARLDKKHTQRQSHIPFLFGRFFIMQKYKNPAIKSGDSADM